MRPSFAPLPLFPKIVGTLDILCHFCNTKTGEQGITESMVARYGEVTKEKLGIVDVRCDSCRETHGEFKNLVEEVERELRIPQREAFELVKTHRKKTQVRAEVDKRVALLNAKIKE